MGVTEGVETMDGEDREYGRAQAWALLTEWTESESLRKHALAVEACVAACGEAEADRLGLAGRERVELIELYSTTALLHDFDYERHPTAEEHPFVGVRVLERLGWPLGVADGDSGTRSVLRRAAGDAPGQGSVCLR